MTSTKNKKLDQNIIRKLYNIRIVINAGNNEKGCYLSGETCKGLITQIDQIMNALSEPLNFER
jgi:hypothetical protein